MREYLELDTEERIKAFTHPYRMKLLHALREAGRPSTATEVARSLGDGPGKAHYHMRILESAGIVEVVRTELVNGIVARYYEPSAKHFSVRGDEGDEGLRDELARMVSRRFREGLKTFLERTMGEAGAEEKGSRGFLFDLTVHCTDDDWRELRGIMDELAARFSSPKPGSRPRRIFVAGATDLPEAEAKADSTMPRRSAPAARWTFGVSLPGSGEPWRPSEPPAR
ncbi:MAG TPA: helix-turn-helix domain-containing protein [Spirochaetales bacterium]|nr:helix-turn-helix transcriptional regulator [Spirochaetia bacterium]HPE35609.1 helix-turn-helix domain-containing protein [Spirochaetales bacterium]